MAEFARRVTQRQDRRNAAVAAAVEPFQAPTRSFVQHPLSPFQDRKRPSAAPIEQTSSETVTAAGGAFFTLYEQDGHTYLQGGSVTGGHGGSATISDYKVVDSVSGPVAAPGTILYLKASCTATVADGVLLPGLELDSASTATGASIPNNHAFTVTSATGDLHYEIGRWNDDSFIPAGPPGNFSVGGCIGNYTLSKA